MNKMIFIIAWRNLWRNTNRTIISLSSIFFAGLLCILLSSYSSGVMNYVVDSVVARETGTFQVMGVDYWEDKVVDNFVQIDSEKLQEYENLDNVMRIAPRINTFAMGWNGAKTRPLIMIAIDSKREREFAGLDERMVEGEFLIHDDNGVMVGKECAKIMSLNVGDTLALVGQGYHGATAAQLFKVKGIVESFDMLQDASVVYTSLSEGQRFLSMPNGISSISVLVEDEEYLAETIAAVDGISNSDNIVNRHWKDLIGATVAGTMEEKKTMVVFFNFLYFIVFFGLLGTVIMLTSERMKEFGMMAAIGTKRSTLMIGMFLELVLITFLGLFLSFIVALPVIANFHYNPLEITGSMAQAFKEYGLEPILPFELSLRLFFEQIQVVFVMSLFITLYPIVKIQKMKIIDTLRD